MLHVFAGDENYPFEVVGSHIGVVSTVEEGLALVKNAQIWQWYRIVRFTDAGFEIIKDGLVSTLLRV